MTKDVLLAIRGLQFDVDNDESKVETINPAQYYMKNDNVRINIINNDSSSIL